MSARDRLRHLRRILILLRRILLWWRVPIVVLLLLGWRVPRVLVVVPLAWVCHAEVGFGRRA